ncbi:MAG TPA: hypothetical protein VL972_06070 [Solirubrobacteraceae bacterium]|nr:hypothetical protein [Solirubrobacteraceae bacterium]
MFRPTSKAAIGVAAALVLLAVNCAAASANTLFVGSLASPGGDSCGNPGYASVQAAITAVEPGGTIEICGGAYKEQLEITKPVTVIGKSNPTILLPEHPASSETTCDHERDAARGGEDQDLVSICTTGTVSFERVIFEAKWPEGTCDDSLYGVLVAGGATLETNRVTLNGAGAFPINGCQGGVGIQVGFRTGAQVGHAHLISDVIENYQKNGVTVDGPGSTLVVADTSIVGAGPVAQGQNGIQVSRGADAYINKATISNNLCNVPQCGYDSAQAWEEDAAGVLLYEAGSFSSVSATKLRGNNIGVEYVSASPTLPTSPELSLVDDKISGGNASVQLNQGNALLEGDTLSGGLIGIDVNSYFEEDNSYAPVATVNDSHISGSQAAIRVEGDLGELPGELSLVASRVKGPIVKEDPLYAVSQ